MDGQYWLVVLGFTLVARLHGGPFVVAGELLTVAAGGGELSMIRIAYKYKLGHRLNDGSYVWTKNFSFKASPYPGQESLQQVIIFGDMGKVERDGSNEYANYQPGALNTTDRIISDLENIDIVFLIGDLTYSNGYISQWGQFNAQVAPITSQVPFMIARYSTDYGMFHFCIADSERDWRKGLEQYEFIEKCLVAVDRKHQPWLIFASHRVLGYSSGAGYVKEGSFAEPDGRDEMQKLWQKYKVDIAFYGHVHNYERSCPIYQNICVKEGTSNYSGGGERNNSRGCRWRRKPSERICDGEY